RLRRDPLLVPGAVDQVAVERGGGEQERDADDRGRAPERPPAPGDRQGVEVGAAHHNGADRDQRQVRADGREQEHEEVEVEELRVEVPTRDQRGGDPGGIGNDDRQTEAAGAGHAGGQVRGQYVGEQRGRDREDDAERRGRELVLDQDQVGGRRDERVAEEEERLVPLEQLRRPGHDHLPTRRAIPHGG